MAWQSQFHGARHRGLVAAVHDHMAPGNVCTGRKVLVVHLGAGEPLNAFHLERARHKSAHACGDEHAA